MRLEKEGNFLACSLLKKQEDGNSKIFAYIFCLRAINDTTHDALHEPPRIDASTAMFSNFSEIRVKKDDSIVHNIRKQRSKEELDTTSKAEQKVI